MIGTYDIIVSHFAVIRILSLNGFQMMREFKNNNKIGIEIKFVNGN